QLSRQRAFLQAPQDDGTPAKAVYVLFGYSTFEYTARSLKEDLLSYSNVPAKLERAESELPPDEAALSKAYRSTLARHWSFLANTDGLEVRRLRRYDQIRSALPSLDVRIYRTANASGTVVILNDQNWQRVDVDGQPAYVYQEVNNDRLCIKLAAEDLPTGTKRLLRDTLREAAEHIL